MLTFVPLGFGIKSLPLNWKAYDLTKFEGTK